MIRTIAAPLLLTVLLVAGLVGCAASRLEEAAAEYRGTRDHDSLKYLAGQMHKGMPRAEVERLLGPPDYSPTDGQDYYSSDKRARIEQDEGLDLEITLGLVVDYRDPRGRVTEQLQGLRFGPIGE